MAQEKKPGRAGWCEGGQTSRALKAVVRSLGFPSRALGSHGGVLSKGGTWSALCFRKTSPAPLRRVGWREQDWRLRDQGGGWGSDAVANGNVYINIIKQKT